MCFVRFSTESEIVSSTALASTEADEDTTTSEEIPTTTAAAGISLIC